MSDVNIEDLCSALTLPEKLSLLAGASTWRTAAIERLGIPNLKFSDGPSGARGEVFGDSVAAAFLPSGVSLGATWDEDLLFSIGQLHAEQCKTKSASVILAPTMCIHRHPLGGRNFESYSEDPFLTGKLATAHVRGVQSRGIGATPKHFVANDQETDRFHCNTIISPRALREVYLLPFQMVVRDADPWCMMSAYNKVNGLHCDMSPELLSQIPRDEWGWTGLFLSDWGGTNSSAASINAGLDLEMPGPPTRRSKEALQPELERGAVDLERVDQSVRRLLELLVKTDRFRDPSDNPEYCDDSPQVRAQLHEAACAGIVLLKNEASALPLQPSEGIKRLAILGPNAKRVVAGGGGSAYIKAPYWTSVHDSVKSRFEGSGTEIVHATGARVNRYLPVMPTELTRNPYTGLKGAAVEWFLGHDLTSKAVATTDIEDMYYVSYGDRPDAISSETDYAFRVRTILTPRTSGRHKLSLASIGPAQLFIDGELVAAQPGAFESKGSLFFTYGNEEIVFEKGMAAGHEYHLTVDCHSHDRQLRPELLEQMDPMEDKFQGVRLGFEEHTGVDMPAEAASLARACDAAIVVVGRDKEWESESQDIPVFELPGEQARLIRAVAAACKRTVVVVQAGTPVQLEPWIDEVQGVVHTWYQGQELGNAAASVLCGAFNPSGRLPVTFPSRIEECPAFESFPCREHTIRYTDDLHVGYKWWDLQNIAPRFPIGFGLSYNTFNVSAATLSGTSLLRGGSLAVRATVRNCGGSELPARQTLIAWASPVLPTRLLRPSKQICGFKKSPPLQPGESYQLEIQFDAYGLGMFDDEKGVWVIDEKSEFHILVGPNALDVTLAGTIEVPRELRWVHKI